MSDISPEDIAAIRKEEGTAGIKALMRAQLAIGKARRETPTEKPARRATGRPPGAWPTGTAPGGLLPPAQYPASAWEAALDDYRRWLVSTDHPERTDTNQTCGCPGCQALTRKDAP